MERPPATTSPNSSGHQPANQQSSGSGEAGPDGNHSAPTSRGKDHAPYIPPPARGTRSDHSPASISPFAEFHREGSDSYGFGPRIDLPHFDGTNPRLWQARCEDYFSMCGTPRSLWVQFASTMFEGPAARWLESVQHRAPSASWEEFCRLLQCRFGRNQHQTLVRKFHNINQAGSVEEYVEQFAKLYDQLSSYESVPESVHYVTRFIDGLQPAVRVMVALHQPQDLDAAYDLALLHESMTNSIPQTGSSARRQPFSPTVTSAKTTPLSKSVDDRRSSKEHHRQATGDDKWSALRAYR